MLTHFHFSEKLHFHVALKHSFSQKIEVNLIKPKSCFEVVLMKVNLFVLMIGKVIIEKQVTIT